MPIYEYVCPACETRFEALRPVSQMDDAAECPKGHPMGYRVLSTFAALSRDGEGTTSGVGGGGCVGCAGNCACGVN